MNRGIYIRTIPYRVLRDSVIYNLLAHCMSIHLIEDWILSEH